MVTSDFVEIASYANAVEAEHTRALLEENGLSAFVDGAAANTALSYVGTAIGGVRVFVRAGDTEQALGIIENVFEESDTSAAPWFCGRCAETVDGTFDVCWSCGEVRASAERPFPVAPDVAPSRPGTEGDSDANWPALDNSCYDQSNPYASPMTAETIAAPGDEGAQISPWAEAMLLRAWRASILGLVFLPFVLHLYSMYLLARAAMTAGKFSPDGEKRFYRAFGVNVVAGLIWGLVIGLALR